MLSLLTLDIPHQDKAEGSHIRKVHLVRRRLMEGKGRMIQGGAPQKSNNPTLYLWQPQDFNLFE